MAATTLKFTTLNLTSFLPIVGCLSLFSLSILGGLACFQYSEHPRYKYVFQVPETHIDVEAREIKENE